MALSFASEQRDYIEKVKDELLKAELRVFYDGDKPAELWGTCLNEKLNEVYLDQSRFCILFISAEYAKKTWMRPERQNVHNRTFGDDRDYFLVARFDNTEIEGLPSTMSYIDLRFFTPEQFAQIVIEKVRLYATTNDLRNSFW